jgi:hypothetical protein
MATPAAPRPRSARLLPPLVAGVVPTLVLAIGSAQFILSHFFTNAAYLLDSGFYSGLVYHNGISPQNPNMALDFAPDYFTFHFSPFVSLFSLLSYLQPLQRVEWYALFQAIVFAPIGIATYALARRLEPTFCLRRLPITLVAALAFSYSGLVLTFVSYPHYEPAIPGLVCLALVFAASGQIRLTWVFIVVAASIREDGGFHTALALMPVLYLRWRGVDTGTTLRQLIAMVATASAMSVAAVAVQKLCFASVTLNYIYLGSPPFGHVTWALIAERARVFVTSCPHIYYPFLATCVVAALRRDARYLLGWAATTPWFLLNFLAVKSEKSIFFAYTGIPFLVAIFWVYLYGARFAPPARRLRPAVIEAVFALVSVSSTLGLHRENPLALKIVAREMLKPRAWPRAQVHGFAEALGKRTERFGRLYVDYGVASLTLEWLRASHNWQPGLKPADAIAFHYKAQHALGVSLNDLLANGLDVCTRASHTSLTVCTRERLPPDTFGDTEIQVIPALFAFSDLSARGIQVTPGGIALRRTSVYANLPPLPAGTYEIKVQIDARPSPAEATVGEIAVQIGDHLQPSVTTAGRELAIRFTVDGKQPILWRVTPWIAAPVTITGARLERVEPQDHSPCSDCP